MKPWANLLFDVKKNEIQNIKFHKVSRKTDQKKRGVCWNLLFLKQQVENLWFYAKQSEKKLWNQQKVPQKVKLAETSHKKKETRDKNFKKAIPAAEMFTSKTIWMRLNLNFWIIFIGNSAVRTGLPRTFFQK